MTVPRQWSAFIGCSPASTGCANCYAPTMAASYGDLVAETKAGTVWTGKLIFNESAIDLPSRTIEPTAFIVNPHGDLFHDNAPDEWIDRVFDCIETNPGHTFQILTKRAERANSYFLDRYPNGAPVNVFLGVSAERQKEANARIPERLSIRCSFRFVTFYPLLEAIDLASIPNGEDGIADLQLIQCGDEPTHPADPVWFDEIGAQCSAYGIPFDRTDLQIEIEARGF